MNQKLSVTVMRMEEGYKKRRDHIVRVIRRMGDMPYTLIALQHEEDYTYVSELAHLYDEKFMQWCLALVSTEDAEACADALVYGCEKRIFNRPLYIIKELARVVAMSSDRSNYVLLKKGHWFAVGLSETVIEKSVRMLLRAVAKNPSESRIFSKYCTSNRILAMYNKTLV